MTGGEVEQKPPVLLLQEHVEKPSTALHHFSGAIALVLTFFASAGLTIAYLSGMEHLPIASQVGAAAVAEDSFATVTISGEGAYVLDLTTSRVLYSKNPDIQLPLASLTKVPLALTISEALKPSEYITIPSHAPPDGAGIRLPTGLRFSVQDLLDFTLAASSNEGADILTRFADDTLRQMYPTAPEGSAALWRMNDIVKNLGLEHLFFLNTTGLDLSDTQASAYGSARDVAVLFAHIASVAPAIFERTSQDTVKITAATGETVLAKNTDNALPSIPGMILGKTGYTELAGGNLVVVFDAGLAHPIVAVVLHSTQEDRFTDMKKLVDATLSALAKDQ